MFQLYLQAAVILIFLENLDCGQGLIIFGLVTGREAAENKYREAMETLPTQGDLENDRKELCADVAEALELQPANDILETFKFGCWPATVQMKQPQDHQEGVQQVQYRYIQKMFKCPLANSDTIYLSYGYKRPWHVGYRIFIYHETSDDTLSPLTGTENVVELTNYIKFYF